MSDALSDTAVPAGPPVSRPVASAPALRRRFTRLLALAILLPALVYGALQLGLDYRASRAQEDAELRLATRLTAISVDQFVRSHLSAVALVADSAAEHDELPRLTSLRTRYPALVTTLATADDGRILAAEPQARARGATSRSVADRDYFRVPSETLEPYVSDAFVGRGLGNEPLVAVAAPVVREGRFDGVVEGSIRIDSFTWLRSSILRSHDQDMLVVDRSGRVIYASAGLPFRFLQPLADLDLFAGEESIDGVSGVASVHLPDGGRMRLAWSQLASGWRVALFMPNRPAAAVLARDAVPILVALLLAVAGAVSVVHWQAGRLAQATGLVLDALRAVAARERSPGAALEHVPPELLPVAQEVDRLAARFEQATAGLQLALERERELAQRLRETVEHQEELIGTRTAEIEAANAELERISRTDPLTGVLNLRGFHAACEALAGPDGGLREPVAVVGFDVDHFKAYNDRYGHPAGDRALRRVAGAAQAALRGAEDRIARVGGEEFVLLLPGATLDVAAGVAERLRASVRGLHIAHEGAAAQEVTVSLGVVAASRGELLEGILAQADEALYRAKHAGRDRVST